MFGAIASRMRARDPLWSVYPSPRLAIVVLAIGAAWLVPGDIGVIAAIVGAAAITVAVAVFTGG